jgi:asparagine synthase (glutamine-hydrolysing)
VPVGFYLSGGLDTSSVVATAAEASDEPVHTFCMGFNDQRWDEREDARAVAEHFDTVHHEIIIEEDFMRDFPRMIWHADEPKRNLYPWYVAEEMREHVKVALGGLGADELFGGYVYRLNRLGGLQKMRGLNPLRETAERLYGFQLQDGVLENDDVVEELSCLRHLDDDAALYVLLNSTDVLGDTDFYGERVLGSSLEGIEPADEIIETLGSHDDIEDLREKALRWDFEVKMPDDFLLVEDRMSMAHSLESRVPFLDNELIDLALSLPLSEKVDTSGNRNVGKLVLRRAMKPKLPDTVFEKDKQGFTMPTYPFVKNGLLDHARSILDEPRTAEAGLIDGDYVDSLVGRRPKKSLTPHYKMLWKLTALEIWYKMYVDRDVEAPSGIESYYP